MCSLITGQAWHFAPCLWVACASSLLKCPPGMLIISLVPTQDLNPARKATLHSPNPFSTTALLFSPLSGLVCSSPACATPVRVLPWSLVYSLTVFQFFLYVGTNLEQDLEIWDSFSFHFLYVTSVWSHRNWVSCPKPSETKESKPNTTTLLGDSMLAIVCLRMTHWFFPLVAGTGFRGCLDSQKSLHAFPSHSSLPYVLDPCPWSLPCRQQLQGLCASFHPNSELPAHPAV